MLYATVVREFQRSAAVDPFRVLFAAMPAVGVEGDPSPRRGEGVVSELGKMERVYKPRHWEARRSWSTVCRVGETGARSAMSTRAPQRVRYDLAGKFRTL